MSEQLTQGLMVRVEDKSMYIELASTALQLIQNGGILSKTSIGVLSRLSKEFKQDSSNQSLDKDWHYGCTCCIPQL